MRIRPLAHPRWLLSAGSRGKARGVLGDHRWGPAPWQTPGFQGHDDNSGAKATCPRTYRWMCPSTSPESTEFFSKH